MTLTEAAYGAYLVANAQMIRAIKAVSTYRGRDPRDFALLAFGGNGPVHAVEIARALQMSQVIVPPAPGLFSAVGLLVADIAYDRVQTFLGRVADLDLAHLNATYAQMGAELHTALVTEGYRSGEIVYDAAADLRYVGQAYELTVPVPATELTASGLAALAETFEREHERTYGHRATSEPVELVNLRLTARIVNAPRIVPRLPVATGGSGGQQRLACFGPQYGYLETPLIDRGDLRGVTQYGPCIIQEYDATTVVPPGCPAHLDAWENIVIGVPRE
jgi:N-methylhydantoinase A